MSQNHKQKHPSKKEEADLLAALSGIKPPQAIDVEAAVLGAMLVEPHVIEEATQALSPTHFYDPRHRTIFEAMSALVNEHVTIDLISESDKLRTRGDLESVGGVAFLSELTKIRGAAAHIEYYLKTLENTAIRRNIIKASYDNLKDAYDDSVIQNDLIVNTYARLDNAVKLNENDTVDIGESINSAMDNLQELQKFTGPSGIPSGYPSIDRITLGWQKSDLIIIASRPSVGKTAFALNIARNAATEHNIPVAYFSLQMTKEKVTRRLVTTESGLSGEKIRGGVNLEPFEWEQLEYTLKRLEKAPLYINDTPAITIKSFCTKARRLVRKKGVRLIIIDYLQLMSAPQKSEQPRYEELGEIVRTLKATAMTLRIPIIALAELNRDYMKRTGGLGKPKLDELSECGQIEQVADEIILIHRPEFTGMSEDPADNKKAWIIFAKSNEHTLCDIEMKFEAQQVKFKEPDQSLDIQPQRPY